MVECYMVMGFDYHFFNINNFSLSQGINNTYYKLLEIKFNKARLYFSFYIIER